MHVQAGPTRVEGENGATGYTYTTGTTGGAAYAIALGSKPRRPAGMSLVTYRDGRPVGIQPSPCRPPATSRSATSCPSLPFPRPRPQPTRTHWKGRA